MKISSLSTKKKVFVPLKNSPFSKNETQIVLECEIKFFNCGTKSSPKIPLENKNIQATKRFIFTVNFLLLLVLANYSFYMKENTSKC